MESGGPVRFSCLLPPGRPHTAADWLDHLDPPALDPGDRPRVSLNMITSLDGRATLAGRTAKLGNTGDRQLFHALRTRADAVMAGAQTFRIERYGPIIRDPELLAERAARGLEPQPLAVTVSRSLSLDPDLPILSDPSSHLVILTPSAGEIPPCAARVSYVRGPEVGPLVRRLRDEFGVRSLVTEGGPTLNAELLRTDLIDEVFLSTAPLLLGGPDPLTIVDGPAVATRLELVGLLELESHLYARYRVFGAASGPSG
ncbi:MAG TPA: dihydrofolate reductase family protein [Solirubrobacteraceae bacterium]|jgi:riboflavin biosynthesis pyrimidine reductase|nr:dihydrofolate reductase family protein [Solirubrobacteraceae bacterium]